MEIMEKTLSEKNESKNGLLDVKNTHTFATTTDHVILVW